MIGLLLVVAFVGLYSLALLWAVVSSLRARFPLGLALVGVLVPLRVVALFVSPAALPAGIASVAACAVVLVMAWRRRTTLPPAAPPIQQIDKVTPPFLLLAILNAAGLTIGLLAAVIATPP